MALSRNVFAVALIDRSEQSFNNAWLQEERRVFPFQNAAGSESFLEDNYG